MEFPRSVYGLVVFVVPISENCQKFLEFSLPDPRRLSKLNQRHAPVTFLRKKMWGRARSRARQQDTQARRQ